MTRTQQLIAAVLTLFLASPAFAQYNSGREHKWEFIFDANYQDSYQMDFEHGSNVSTGSDWGFGIGGAYHYSNRLTFQFIFDYLDVSYDAHVANADIPPGPGVNLHGTAELWTPRINVIFNILEGNFTPYISAGIGYSWIDTNIPNGPPQTGCWWDPWWGYICSTWQDTRSMSDFAYQAGAGIRWDISRGVGLRLGYEREWVNISNAEGTPGWDVLRLGFSWKY